MNDNIASIKILRSNENTTIAMTYRYYFKKKPDSLGRIKCVIPAFNIIFSVENEINAEARANEFIDVFFKHFLESKEITNKNMNKLMIQLINLGFRSSPIILKQLLANERVSGVLDIKQRDVDHYKDYTSKEVNRLVNDLLLFYN